MNDFQAGQEQGHQRQRHKDNDRPLICRYAYVIRLMTCN